MNTSFNPGLTKLDRGKFAVKLQRVWGNFLYQINQADQVTIYLSNLIELGGVAYKWACFANAVNLSMYIVFFCQKIGMHLRLKNQCFHLLDVGISKNIFTLNENTKSNMVINLKNNDIGNRSFSNSEFISYVRQMRTRNHHKGICNCTVSETFLQHFCTFSI